MRPGGSDRGLGQPTQAVILAGGRGTRLKPLTDERPKPMIEFHGRPFLEYLLELLRSQGVEKVLLLVGYKGEWIRRHFGDGSRLGLEIEYSCSPESADTGRRLKRAYELLDPHFLLLYCDNYWPLRFADMWSQFLCNGTPAMITVYRNLDRYSRDNVRVDGSGCVVAYDKSRTAPGLQGVEIGFAVLPRTMVANLPDANVSLEATLYPELVKRRQLSAYVTDHRYYSVGSHDRLSVTEAFLARRPAVFLDRDGVLNRKPPRAEYVRSWSEFEWLPGAREALRLLTERGYLILIVSNQAGIARHALTEGSLGAIHTNMITEAAQAGARIDRVYHCPHGWTDECECRKPRPGMLYQAQHDWNLDLSRTCVIGDDERDALAAASAGCPSMLVTEDRSLLDIVQSLRWSTDVTYWAQSA